jgi:hypothetical protein
MNRKILIATLVLTTLVLAPGCATHLTASGGRETILLGGAVSVSTKSFQPITPATLDVETTKVASTGNPTGNRISLLCGIITLHDY